MGGAMYIDKEARDKIIEITEEMQGVICKLCIRLNPHHRECPMCDEKESFINAVNSIPVDDSPVNKSGNITLTEKENELLSMLYRALGIMNTPHSKQYNKFFKGLVEDLRKFLKIKI